MKLDNLVEKIKNGYLLGFDEAIDLADNVDASSLAVAADIVRTFFHREQFDLCSIINAKSGRCSEDCKYCAQSSYYNTDIDQYELIDLEDALLQGIDNDRHKIKRISLVTAGKFVTDKQLDFFAEIYQQLSKKTSLDFCASMGFLTIEKAKRLVDFGVSRYHCNLETCQEFFPEICTTHSWQEKVDTINIARDAGLDICSGGIIGMGESQNQRIKLAFELRELGIKSIPVNILSPIPNTPLQDFKQLSESEIVTSIAMFRLINPTAVVRMAGGRNQLGDRQYNLFKSGANGAIVGNYLTTAGNNVENDLAKIQKMGYLT